MRYLVKIILSLFISSFSSLTAQESSLKEKAQNAFKSEHYDKAIRLLNQRNEIVLNNAPRPSDSIIFKRVIDDINFKNN